MKATLEFNLPEDQIDFEMATQGLSMHSALWEMDQWLRSQYKYMSDEDYNEDKYDTYYEVREKLREIIGDSNINFDH